MPDKQTIIATIPIDTYNVATALVNIKARENPQGKYSMDKLVKDALDFFCLKVVQKAYDSMSMKGDDHID